jgi:hypothetical protein
MENQVSGLILIMVFLIPLLYFTIDHIIKGAYILYWQSIFKSRFGVLFEFLKFHPSTVSIRRKTLDGKYIISLISESISYRPYEYLVDFEKNTIEILGVGFKSLRMIDGGFYIASKVIKIPKEYKDELKSHICPIDIKPLDIKRLKIRTKPRSLYDDNSLMALVGDEIDYSELNKKRIRKVNDMAHDVYIERTYTEPDLYKIIKIADFKRLCVNVFKANDIISKKEMNEIITNKIMEYSYHKVKV